FGAPCIVPMVLLPRMVGEGVMSMLFPLFVLVAIAADPRGGPQDSEPLLGRVPIFRFASAQASTCIELMLGHREH
ncbi:hypothetical protein CYMTET_25428, partial [Cymbomonas tetramitiformis]